MGGSSALVLATTDDLFSDVPEACATAAPETSNITVTASIRIKRVTCFMATASITS